MANAVRATGYRLPLAIAVLIAAFGLAAPASSRAQVVAVLVNVDSGLVDDQTGTGDIALDLLQRIYRGEKANIPGQRRKRYDSLYLPPRECGGLEDVLNIIYPPDFDRNRKQALVDGNVKRPEEVSFRQAVAEVSKNTGAFAVVDVSAIADGEGTTGESTGQGRCRERGRLLDNVKVLTIDGADYQTQGYPLRIKTRTRG